jgi:hypothetical protein
MKRTIIIAITACIILIFVVGAWVFLGWYRGRGANMDAPILTDVGSRNGVAGSDTVAGDGVSVNAASRVAVDPAVLKRQQARQLATSFIERHGSFSSDSNFGNIADLLIFMTPELRAESSAAIQRGRMERSSRQAPVPYFGIVSKVITSNEIRYDGDVGTAAFELEAQRRKTDAGGTTEVVIEGAVVEMVHRQGIWLVERFFWK